MHRFTTGLFRTAALATLAIVATGCSYYKITDPKVRRRVFELTKQLGKSFAES